MNAKVLNIIFSITCALGICVLVGGIVLKAIFPHILNNQLDQKIPLRKNSVTFKNWKEAATPPSMKFFIFNVTNPDRVINYGEKPHVEELGPYLFDEFRTKEHVELLNGGTAISYHENKSYFFNRQKSISDLSDIVTVVNLPLLGIIDFVKHAEDPFMQSFMGQLLQGKIKEVESWGNTTAARLFMDRTVGEILFEGHKVEVLEQMLSGFDSEIAASLSPLKNNTFGLMYLKNGTLETEWRIQTGVEDRSNYANVYSLNQNETLYWWKPGACQKLRGTDGLQFAPVIEKDQALFVYNEEMCRALEFHYTGDSKVHGLDVLRFKMPKIFYQSPFENENNMCYCMQNDIEKCRFNGIIDVSQCYKAPIQMSAPHFFRADTFLFENIDGMTEADPELHETFLDIEPFTGFSLRVAKRVQINTAIKNKDLKEYGLLGENVTLPLFYMPFAWMDESAEASRKSVQEIRDEVTNQVKIVNISFIVLCVAGSALILISLALCVVKTKKKSVSF